MILTDFQVMSIFLIWGRLMIIYFNFYRSKIEFWQQNTYRYFAVDFLYDSVFSNDFKTIIDDVFKEKKEIIEFLKKEKNFLVLPDEVVGFGNMEVPFSRWHSKQYFSTRFNLIYNKNKDMVCKEILLNSNNKHSNYLFYFTRKIILNNILKGFLSFGIKIEKVSFLSKVILDALLKKHREFQKENIVVVYNGFSNVKLLIASFGNLLGFDTFDSSKNHDVNNLNDTLGGIVKRNTIKEKNYADYTSKLIFNIENLVNYYKKEDLIIDIDKIIFINMENTLFEDSANVYFQIDDVEIIKSFGGVQVWDVKKGL